MNKGLVDILGCPVNFLQSREHHAAKIRWGSNASATSFLSSRLDTAQSLYKRDLHAHFGCVNAIEFSQDGCYLISGGDDRRVLLWNLESSLSESAGGKPTPMKEEHSSNIFCLSFDSQNSRIFSAGNDEQVLVHDIETREAVNVFLHEEAIYGVSINPCVPTVFASAGEDGQILIFDTNAPPSAGPLQLARSYDAFHSVQFHPTEPTFIVTANSKEGVILWDVRKPRVPCIKYGSRKTPQSSMCARFNSSGTQIVALRRRMHPILFNTSSSISVCEFDADYYYNSCTMKSCCFAGSRDQFILSGSDDFNLYMWRIPDPVFERAFVPEAHLILKGHRSIVNQVRFNVHNFMIASSGVEKIVKLWSAVSVPGSVGTLTKEKGGNLMARKVYTHEDYIGLVLDSGQTVSHDYSHGNTDEDPKMIAFFDSLVQREVEGWTTNTDHSDDDLESTTSNPTQSSSSSSQQQHTSHSDDSDIESTPDSPPPPLPLRRRSFRAYSSRTPPLPPTVISEEPVGSPGASHNGSDLDTSPKPSQGSEWILRLIAKKRAQLRAASIKRRRAKEKHKTKTKRFFRCFNANRPCLYRPENNNASTLSPSNRAAPVYLLRRRNAIAPYTMLSLGNFREDENSDEESESEAGGMETESLTTNSSRTIELASVSADTAALSRRNICSSGSTEFPSVAGTSAMRETSVSRLWSSDSNSCDEEDMCSIINGACNVSDLESRSLNNADKLSINSTEINNHFSIMTNCHMNGTSNSTRIKLRNTDNACRLDNGYSYTQVNGVSTDETDSSLVNLGGQDEASTASHTSYSNGNSSREMGRNTPDLVFTNVSYAENRNELSNFDSSYNESLIPSSLDVLASTSTSLLPNSSVHLNWLDQVEINELPSGQEPINCNTDSSVSTPAEGSLQANCTGGGLASTPDSGISVGERLDKRGEGSSSSESEVRKPNTFFKKKKISENRMKSYRSRFSLEDDDGDDGIL